MSHHWIKIFDNEAALQNNVAKGSSMAVSNASPVFSGTGRFVDIAGVVTGLEENVLTKDIVGKSGVAFAVVTKKTLPTALQNYNGNRKNLERSLKGRSLQIFEALKENSEIEIDPQSKPRETLYKFTGFL